MTTHIALLTPKDQADLDRAADLKEEGRKLRARVMARLRQRAWRKTL